MRTLPETNDLDVLEARRSARELVGAVVDVLNRHRLLVLTEEDLERARDDVFADAVFIEWLPDRFVHYDGERIYEDGDYADLTWQIGQATGGEWEPTGLTSRLIVPTQDVSGSASVSFRHSGETLTWDLEYYGSDWVSGDFLTHLNAFTTAHLSGDFVPLPAVDQCQELVYLPRRTAAEITRIFARCHGSWPCVWQ